MNKDMEPPAASENPLVDYLAKKQVRDMERDWSKPLGYELSQFKGLETKIDGLQPGLYLIASETDVGKTSFLCNLLLDLLESNHELNGLYFSLDDSKDAIINRLLSIISGIDINRVQRPDPDTANNDLRIQAYHNLKDLAERPRGSLFLFDQSDVRRIQDLEREIEKLAAGKLFVIVDGIFNLESAADGDDTGVDSAVYANRLKAVADIYKIPVICTGQLRKRGHDESHHKPPAIKDLFDSGKSAHSANLVLLLYPENYDSYDKDDTPVLCLKFAKNKISPYRKTDKLRFNRNLSLIEEL